MGFMGLSVVLLMGLIGYMIYTRLVDQDAEVPTTWFQGLNAFFRGYYHYKSADWENNKPFELDNWSASELSKMPTYYIMNKNETMSFDQLIDNLNSNSDFEMNHETPKFIR